MTTHFPSERQGGAGAQGDPAHSTALVVRERAFIVKTRSIGRANAIVISRPLRKLADAADDRASRRRRQRLYQTSCQTSWAVYAKRPMGGPQQVFRYLGRYTHRVAIGNSRLVSIDSHAVVFRTHGSDTASLPPADFIARFLLHILPKGFVKIRHFGIIKSPPG